MTVPRRRTWRSAGLQVTLLLAYAEDPALRTASTLVGFSRSEKRAFWRSTRLEPETECCTHVMRPDRFRRVFSSRGSFTQIPGITEGGP